MRALNVDKICKNRLQFKSPYLLCAIVTLRTCQNEALFMNIVANDLHIVGDTPYRFGAIKL